MCTPPQGPGLSAYLEDIESDEGDLLMVDEEEKTPGGPFPDTAPSTPSTTQVGSSSGQPSKEQLLQKMDTVDRDIAATEGQISALQKRQVCVCVRVMRKMRTLALAYKHESEICIARSLEVNLILSLSKVYRLKSGVCIVLYCSKTSQCVYVPSI